MLQSLCEHRHSTPSFSDPSMPPPQASLPPRRHSKDRLSTKREPLAHDKHCGRKRDQEVPNSPLCCCRHLHSGLLQPSLTLTPAVFWLQLTGRNVYYTNGPSQELELMHTTHWSPCTHCPRTLVCKVCCIRSVKCTDIDTKLQETGKQSNTTPPKEQ